MSGEKGLKGMKNMHAAQKTDYLGALLPEEERLVLVPIDADDPWAAFKQMRSFMKKSKAHAQVDIYERETPVSTALAGGEVIDLTTRRRVIGL